MWIYKVLLITSPLSCFRLLLLYIKLASIFLLKSFCGHIFSYLLRKYLGVELLGQIENIYFCLFSLFCDKNTSVVIWKVMGMSTILVVLKLLLAYVHTLQIACIKYKLLVINFTTSCFLIR